MSGISDERLQELIDWYGFYSHSRSRDVLSALLALKEQIEKERWIPVSERLPEDDVWVLAYVAENNAVWAYTYDVAEGLWLDGEAETVYGITHWRPLPDAPSNVERTSIPSGENEQ